MAQAGYVGFAFYSPDNSLDTDFISNYVTLQINDRVKRIPMLAASIVLWSIASLLGAFAGSYSTLLLTRLLLGAVVATAGPAIASLTGDYFPAKERGKIYAYILGGEIGGNALGFIVCGSVACMGGPRKSESDA